MHILAINDDGPPSQQSSPYVHSFVLALQAAGHIVSVILPHQQRSWISKAHFVGQITKPTYFRPGTVHHDDGTTHPEPVGEDEDVEEWVLINGTPASCAQLGLFHFFRSRGPVDLVISGPNYGRNATSLFNLSSGTIGGAMEGAVCGKKAVALSFAFESRDHVPELIAGASRHAVRLIEYLVTKWPADVDLYNINVPLIDGIAEKKVLYTNALQNHWTMGSSFEEVDAVDEGKMEPGRREKEIRQETMPADEENQRKHVRHQHRHFKWAPKFADVKQSVAASEPGNDGWAILQGYTSVTPLKANFMHSSAIPLGELKLDPANDSGQLSNRGPLFHATIDYQDSYVQPIILSSLKRIFRSIPHRIHHPLFTCPPTGEPWLQICSYESLDFETLLQRPSDTLANSYVIRKALIRKHYLAHTVSTWLSKHPQSILKDHVKPTFDFEVDFAEFLDDALLEAYELKESLDHNGSQTAESRGWWILKPGMSDRGHGIRLFSTMEELQSIFDEWDPSDTDDDNDDDDVDAVEDVDEKQEAPGPISSADMMTSQLRHFVAQPYLSKPLLLPIFQDRKFHIRVYVLAVGALEVYVYDRMLALCASKAYSPPGSKSTIDLEEHLTNTCLQSGAGEPDRNNAVHVIDSDFLNNSIASSSIFEQISATTAETFEAASRGQMIHFQTLPNAFEVFGLDFLIDADSKAWLLEINAFPDFAQSGREEGREVVEGFWEAVIKNAVGSWVNRLPSRDLLINTEVPNVLEGQEKQSEAQRTSRGDLRRVLAIDLGRR